MDKGFYSDMMLRRMHIVDELLNRLPFCDEELEYIDQTSDFVFFLDQIGTSVYMDPLLWFHTFVFNKEFNRFSFFKMKWFTAIMKYLFVIEEITMVSPDELGVLDLPYLESGMNDIECALKLADGKYFKQSKQVLRSGLEAVIIHIYFMLHKFSYNDIRNMAIPPMNDKRRGMINSILIRNIISSKEANDIIVQYRSLSEAVHSKFAHLNCIFEEYDENAMFHKLADCIRGVVELVLRLILRLYSVSNGFDFWENPILRREFSVVAQ
jgi:hypothetical protein